MFIPRLDRDTDDRMTCKTMEEAAAVSKGLQAYRTLINSSKKPV